MKSVYCKECVYPYFGVNLSFQDGVCSACLAYKEFNKISENDWKKREEKLISLIEEHKKKNSSNYDCVIPVSGGKDSFFQTYYATKKLNLKPLLVTYNGNNFLPEGEYNRELMRKVLDADHISWGPSVEVLKKLNIVAFEVMGDMNWHNHCGIVTSPIIIAAKFNIKYILWGEVDTDIFGMFDPNDYVEFSHRIRKEHSLRGYDSNFFLKGNFGKINFNKKDLIWSIYPKDSEIIKSEIRGLFLGNYMKWDAENNVKFLKENYGWKAYEKGFERTYRNFSNLDDRYENGIHDLMKFVKFGYGRASDHASKDIRAGRMTREEGVKMVLKYDHVVSSDLNYWLNYVDKTEDYFWETADKFRDPRIWSIENGKWYKIDIDNKKRFYGDVRLSKDEKNNFENKKLEIIKKYSKK